MINVIDGNKKDQAPDKSPENAIMNEASVAGTLKDRKS